jgi:hypothetical protein
MEENPSKILSGIVENWKIINPKCENMATILFFSKKMGLVRALNTI